MTLEFIHSSPLFGASSDRFDFGPADQASCLMGDGWLAAEERSSAGCGASASFGRIRSGSCAWRVARALRDGRAERKGRGRGWRNESGYFVAQIALPSARSCLAWTRGRLRAATSLVAEAAPQPLRLRTILARLAHEHLGRLRTRHTRPPQLARIGRIMSA